MPGTVADGSDTTRKRLPLSVIYRAAIPVTRICRQLRWNKSNRERSSTDMRLLLRHRWVSIPPLAGLVAVCSSTVHPFAAPKQFQGHMASIDDLKLPTEIRAIFRRSCMDCHSSQTVWRWYSYVAPVSWLVERDVRRGRDHMNLSEWQKYTLQQRQKLLADLASTVKNPEMPLPQYTLIHREARLSEADRDLVYQWAPGERRTLRAESQSLASHSTPAHDHLQPSTDSEAMH
jgi:hypothetical protein